VKYAMRLAGLMDPDPTPDFIKNRKRALADK
jgi:hypothetical protein